MTGRAFLCDKGAAASSGELLDGTFRLHYGQVDVGAMCLLGTFSQWVVVPEGSAVKIDDDLPLDVACLLACGVPTGWGSAVNVAEVGPGDVVVIYGVGGVGMNAVQGSALAGARTIVAVDPVPWKLERAKAFGAHHTFTAHEQAMEFLVEHTRGVLADKAIVIVGNVEAGVVAQAVDAVSKAGTVVLTGMSDPTEVPTIQLNGTFMAVYAKRLLTTLYGHCNPHVDIPKLAGLYRNGQLKLDELITARYQLADVNKGVPGPVERPEPARHPRVRALSRMTDRWPFLPSRRAACPGHRGRGNHRERAREGLRRSRRGRAPHRPFGARPGGGHRGHRDAFSRRRR